MRVREQRRRQAELEEKRKEMLAVRTEIERSNADRQRRKDEYRLKLVRERLQSDDIRRTAFATQREGFRERRVRNQFQAQMQRQLIQSAIRHMAVWKMWDMDVVQGLISDPGATKHRTVEDIIRRKSSQLSLERRRHSTATVGSRSTSHKNTRMYRNSENGTLPGGATESNGEKQPWCREDRERDRHNEVLLWRWKEQSAAEQAGHRSCGNSGRRLV